MSIKEISDILLNAREPEDVFTGSTKEEIKKEYRRLAKICHPDIAPQNEKELAEKTTILLNEFYEKANKKLEEGLYGIKDPKELYKKYCHCHTSDRCHWCGNPFSLHVRERIPTPLRPQVRTERNRRRRLLARSSVRTGSQ